MNRRLLLCLLLAIAAAPAQDNAAGPPEEFRKAYALAGEQRYEESLAILDQVLERVEHARNGLFSAGNIAIQAGQFERARGYLERLKELEPNAGQVRSLLVQA
jgi:tetratricopeptide (TPR) repeat protein